MKRRMKEISLWVLSRMFLSLVLSEWVLQSPAHSRTHPICFCLDYASWQPGYFGDCFFLYHLFFIFLHLYMVSISCQSTMQSLSNRHTCLLQLYLSRLRFSQLAQCSLQSSRSGTLPPPAATLPWLCWAQLGNSHRVTLPNSSKMWLRQALSWQAPRSHSQPG